MCKMQDYESCESALSVWRTDCNRRVPSLSYIQRGALQCNPSSLRQLWHHADRRRCSQTPAAAASETEAEVGIFQGTETPRRAALGPLLRMQAYRRPYRRCQLLSSTLVSGLCGCCWLLSFPLLLFEPAATCFEQGNDVISRVGLFFAAFLAAEAAVTAAAVAAAVCGPAFVGMTALASIAS